MLWNNGLTGRNFQSLKGQCDEGYCFRRVLLAEKPDSQSLRTLYACEIHLR